MSQLNGPAPGNEAGTVTQDGAALPAVPRGADPAGAADKSAPNMAALADALRAPAGTAASPRPASKTSGASFAAAAGTASANDTTESAAPIGVLPAASTAAPAPPALSAEQTASAVALALIEGSDATGASASAAQASGSAAAAAGNAAQGPMLQTAGVPAPSTPAVATVTLTIAAASAATLGDADKHARGGAGDSVGGEGAAAFQQFGFEGAAAGPVDASAASPTHLKVDASIDSAEFPQGLAERVTFMVDNNLNGARLQVNPRELGPIELTIAVQGDHAQVWMSTHSAVTRDALESSLPKLRDMLGAQGFGQVSVDISQRSFQDRSGYSRAYEPAPLPVGSAAADVPSPQATPRASLSALDTYA